MAVNHIPEGYSSVTPYLHIAGAARAIEFYKKAFGAEELLRMEQPDGKLGHAEIRIGDSTVMLADESEEWGNASPSTLGGTSISMMIYVPNVDEVFRRAIEEGAAERSPVSNQFYGDRSGTLQDPFGHRWTIATHVEDIEPEEMERRAREWTAQQQTA